MPTFDIDEVFILFGKQKNIARDMFVKDCLVAHPKLTVLDAQRLFVTAYRSIERTLLEYDANGNQVSRH